MTPMVRIVIGDAYHAPSARVKHTDHPGVPIARRKESRDFFCLGAKSVAFTADKKPWFAVEAKSGGDRGAGAALGYFRERLAIPFSYVVALEGGRSFVQDGVHHVPASDFLGALA
jgi:hypothetical protein